MYVTRLILSKMTLDTSLQCMQPFKSIPYTYIGEAVKATMITEERYGEGRASDDSDGVRGVHDCSSTMYPALSCEFSSR